MKFRFFFTHRFVLFENTPERYGISNFPPLSLGNHKSKKGVTNMKKRIPLTAALLVCLSLLTVVPHVKAYTVEVPESSVETIPCTQEPRETPDYADDSV